MMSLIEAAAKIFNLIMDAIANKDNNHEEILKKFEAAMEEAKGAMAKLKAATEATDAKADAALEEALRLRGD